MRAQRARALSRSSSISAPAPAEGTKPHAVALMDREARSGASLKLRQSTRMESKPAQAYGESPSQPPASTLATRPSRTIQYPLIMDSVLVAHALLLLVTCPPVA